MQNSISIRQRAAWSFAFLPFVIFLIQVSAFGQGLPDPIYEEGTIYVKTWDSSSVDIKSHAGIGTLFDQYDVTNIDQPFTTCDDISFTHIYQVNFSEGSAEDLIDNLSVFTFIEYAEKVPIKKITLTPDDPLTSYHLPLINAEEAFDLHTGGGAIVAIVDDAILTDHEDLADNIVSGYDVADDDDDPNPPNTVTPNYFSHGTRVAGVAGAVTDNGIGISSIGWNNKIMGVKCVKIMRIRYILHMVTKVYVGP